MGADAGSPHAFGRTVPATAENIAPLRRAIVALAARGGAGDKPQSDIAVAVSEVCANVVVHAYPPDDVGVLIVDAELDRGELVVRVSDLGQGMVPRPDSPGLGLGLPLIASLADRMEIHDGPDGIGTTVELGFRLGA
jgi:serine/threonine-protein kinase RsbW/stage II sporulation protein AB (anti-sigma F factor)